jgi:4-hydroxybenzoate polyprenyltransferase
MPEPRIDHPPRSNYGSDRVMGRRHIISGLWRTMRPRHWIKNSFVIAPIVFTPAVLNAGNLLEVAACFAIFCATASAIYMINDIADFEHDREHPDKQHRPIASGELSIRAAAVSAVLLTTAGILLSLALSSNLTVIVLLYLLINLAYSFWLKHIVIIDVFCVASGFLLRILAGAAVINVTPSPWILICTLLLALFIVLGKRQHELLFFRDNRNEIKHRPVLAGYSLRLVDQLITVVTSSTILAYLLYTLDPNTILRLDAPYLFTTGIFVILGVFRYLFIVNKGTLAGNPEELVYKDPAFLAVVLGWMLSVVTVIYFI